ncbi:hypothetical protein B296_00014109, partial [Ensete ventricosum]
THLPLCVWLPLDSTLLGWVGGGASELDGVKSRQAPHCSRSTSLSGSVFSFFRKRCLLEDLNCPSAAMAASATAAGIGAGADRRVQIRGFRGLRSPGLIPFGRPLPAPPFGSSSVIRAVSTFMLRTKNPCGKVPNKLYLVMDDLADEFGIGTLRLTTRQTFQLHGIPKKDLKTVMSTIIKNMGSTLGACGDLNRNVLAPAAPFTKKEYVFAQETAENIATLLTPQSGAYYDLWVDGEKVMSAEPPEVVKARNDNSHGTNFPDLPEPIYGTQFLPRKFKIAVTLPRYVDRLNLTAMACPALPLCPLAITEAERGIPDILKRVRSVFDKVITLFIIQFVGLKYNESVVIRVTGCPNGCARPYMAELGLVGDGPNSYQIWLGGTPNQTRLAKSFMDKVKIQDLEKVLEPLFYNWRIKRERHESFGDFTTRMGFDKLHELVEKWEGPEGLSSRFNLKLFADRQTYEAVANLAKLQNKTAHQLAMEVIRNYVAAQQNGKGK